MAKKINGIALNLPVEQTAVEGAVILAVTVGPAL